MIELKLRASNADAEADYKDLVMMIDVLRYPLGLFVNIASEVTYAELIPVAPWRSWWFCAINCRSKDCME